MLTEGMRIVVKYPDHDEMKGEIIGFHETIEGERWYKVQYDREFPYFTDTVHPKYLEAEECPIHLSQPVFHDKEEEWLCPFCIEE